jgi:hypothetical protein
MDRVVDPESSPSGLEPAPSSSAKVGSVVAPPAEVGSPCLDIVDCAFSGNELLRRTDGQTLCRIQDVDMKGFDSHVYLACVY